MTLTRMPINQPVGDWPFDDRLSTIVRMWGRVPAKPSTIAIEEAMEMRVMASRWVRGCSGQHENRRAQPHANGGSGGPSRRRRSQPESGTYVDLAGRGAPRDDLTGWDGRTWSVLLP